MFFNSYYKKNQKDSIEESLRCAINMCAQSTIKWVDNNSLKSTVIIRHGN